MLCLKNIFIKLSLVASILVLPAVCSAGDLQQNLVQVLEKHDLIQAAKADLAGADENVGVAWSAWFPTVTASYETGPEDYNRYSGADTSLWTSDGSVSVRQLVWDFGETNSAIDKADATRMQADYQYQAQYQDLLLAALEAHINLKRAWDVLGYAKRSVENIKTQARLEDARIESGKGYTTDSLQAKSQLLGARARQIRAEGVLKEAIHRYHNIFGDDVKIDLENLEDVAGAMEMLPGEETEAIALAFKDNPTLLVEAARLAGSEAEVSRVTAAKYAPELYMKGAYENKHNQDGTKTDADSFSAAAGVSWDFNFGGDSWKSVSAAEDYVARDKYRLQYRQRVVTEEVRNAWSNYETAVNQYEMRKNQADVTEQFLILARQERELGKRSLLDVLNGETSWINAESDAAAAKAEVTIAVLRMSRSVGQLELKGVSINAK